MVYYIQVGYNFKMNWGESMNYAIGEILKDFTKRIEEYFGQSLIKVLLYGSYARGDFRADSDIDIMILVDMTDEEISQRGHVLSDLTFEYNFDHELMIMPIVKNKDHFEKWLRAYPFYNNIKKEGVELYAA